jgi:hypothetical protein
VTIQIAPSLSLEKAVVKSYDKVVKALNAHFDGKFIVLDEPSDLKPNTKVKVIAAIEADNLATDFAHLSEPTFQKIWDNPLDADYDQL